MAKKRKQDHERSKTLVPQARASARAAKSSRRRRRANVFPATSIMFNRRGELVITDPALQQALTAGLGEEELVIRFGPIPLPVPQPPPNPNTMCGCRSLRFREVKQENPGRRRVGR